jgi:hypothetical protein
MKKLLILAYVIAVLLLSGMVKADQNGVADVESAQVNASGIISVHSFMPTSCHQRPRIVVSNINETDKTLKLLVQTQVVSKMCADVETPKLVIFDLKILPLRVGTTYDITFERFVGEQKNPLTYKAISNDFNLEKLDMKQNEFKGTLINYKKVVSASSSNVVLALQKGNDIFPVATTDMSDELSLLVGGEVHITGYVLNAATMLDSANDLAQSSQIKSMIVPVSVSQ